MGKNKINILTKSFALGLSVITLGAITGHTALAAKPNLVVNPGNTTESRASRTVNAGGNYRDGHLCSGGPGHTVNQLGVGVGSGAVSGYYAVKASVDPISFGALTGMSGDQVAEYFRTHHSQATGELLTPYGKYLESNKTRINNLLALMKEGGIGENSNYRKEWEDILAGAKAAAADSESLQKPLADITLSSENKEGLAKGGGLTYTLFAKRAAIASDHLQDYYDEYECVSGTDIEIVMETVGVSPYFDRAGYEAAGSPGGNSALGYVKCPAGATQHGGGTGTFGGFEMSCSMSVPKPIPHPWSRWVLTESRKMIDGNYTGKFVDIQFATNGFPPVKSYQVGGYRCKGGAHSIEVGQTVDNNFFGHNCDSDDKGNGGVFGCTPSKNSSVTESQNNIGANGKRVVKKGFYGAQSFEKDNTTIDKTSSDFQFFRDNTEYRTRLDVWAVKSNVASNVTTPSTAAKTFIVLDTNGTPNTDMFKLLDSNKNLITNGEDIIKKNNFLLDGLQNNFLWQSSWASDVNRSHKMNTTFAYKPQITATGIPAKLNQNGIAGPTESLTYNIDVFCDVNYNTGSDTKSHTVNLPKELSSDDDFLRFLNTNFVDSPQRTLMVRFAKTSSE